MGRAERGSAGIGLAVGGWCLIVMMMFGVGALRLTGTNGEVSSAARAAARAAVNAYDREAGLAAARDVAAEILDRREPGCRHLDVAVEGNWRPGGWVAVTVTCTVTLDDLAPAGFADERTISHTAVELVDRFRGDGDG